MTISQLEALLAVDRWGSLTTAAARTGYTQSGLSRQVAALERAAGAVLVERGARGAVLTTAGRAALPHARRAVHEARRALEAARRASDGQSVFALGSVPSASVGLAPRLLRILREQHRPARLDATVATGLTPTLLEWLHHGEVDAALVTDAPPGLPSGHGMLLTHLTDDPMVVLVPGHHPRLDAGQVGLRALREETWIEDNDGSAALLRRLADRTGVAVDIEMGANDLLSKVALVAEGHGVALVPRLVTVGLRSDIGVLGLHHAPTRQVFLATPPTTSAEVLDVVVEATGRALDELGIASDHQATT